MRFLTRTPQNHILKHTQQVPKRRRLYRALFSLALAACCATPFPAFAETVNFALYAADLPYGEATASLDLGGFALTARHVEFLGYLNRVLHSEAADEANPLVRSSRLAGDGVVELNELAPGAALPLGLSVDLDEWDSGRQDLRITAETGLQVAALTLDHRLTVTASATPGGAGLQRRTAGRLRLGLAVLDGSHEGVVEYDAGPVAQLTALGLTSQWRFEGGQAARFAVVHRPLERRSEARFGYRQPLGPFELTSDIAADSAGAYAVGLGLAIPLGPAPEPVSWSLGDLLAGLNGERRRPDGTLPFLAE